MDFLAFLQPVVGVAALIGVSWAISDNRRRFPWRVVGAGLALQFALAALLIRLPGSQIVFSWIGSGVEALASATEAGTSFVFGFLGGAPLPYDETLPGGSITFAFRVLPMVILISSLAAVLYHYRILPYIVRGFAWALSKTLGINGAASFATAANVFIGMVEAPLMVRPYLAKMSRSDLFIVMVGGMATISGTLFAVYTTMLSGLIPDPAGHLLTASIISAPAAILIARIMSPPDSDDDDGGERVELAQLYENGIDALTRGVIEGLRLLAYIIGMLIVFLALIELANILLALPPLPESWGELSFERIFGWVLAPAAWALGVPWSEATHAGQLLGAKVVLNEFVAYVQMSSLPPGTLSERSGVIMAYALCGFGNFGSIGIMIGGIGAVVPERRLEIAQLGIKSIIAGSIATGMTGAIAGLIGV